MGSEAYVIQHTPLMASTKELYGAYGHFKADVKAHFNSHLAGTLVSYHSDPWKVEIRLGPGE